MIFKILTQLKNTITFPRRGDPPPDQPPYVRDPGDPYVFHLPWAECRQRTEKQGCGGCGGAAGTAWCKSLDELTDRVRCHLCERPDKGP